MTGRGWGRAVVSDLTRHWRHFAASAAGIVLGVGSLVFFLALGLGVRGVLLTQIFPANFLEVAPRAADIDLFALRLDLGRDTLASTDIETLGAIDGVAAVYPKMRLTAPAVASGGRAIFGAGMQTEIVADGIDPALVAGESGRSFFEPSEIVVPDAPCASDAQCGPLAYCDRGPGFSSGSCRPYVPVLVSPYVIELYNGAFRRAYHLPKVNPDALQGMTFEMTFGASSLRPARRPPIRERMRLAGVSDKAIPLGVTLPLEEVRRLNRALDSTEAGDRYHSAILEVTGKGALPGVVEAVERAGFTVSDRGARRAALLTAVVMVVLALVGTVLIAVAAAHIMHVFYLVVMMRRREIGVLRAVGARRSDIRLLLVSEAVVIGLLASGAGIVAARCAALAADHFAGRYVPDFPFKPETFFVFPPLMVVGVAVLATAVCVLGALPPAIRAVSGDPSDALSGQ